MAIAFVAGGRRWLAAAGAVQGLALWLLFESWPQQVMAAAGFAAACAFIGVASLVMHMAWTGQAFGRLAATSAVVGGVAAAVTFSVASGLPPTGTVLAQGDETLVISWLFVLAILLYVSGPYLQIWQRTGVARFAYSDLYRHAWSNAFIVALAQLHVGVLWLVLELWAGLFRLLGIKVFGDLFHEKVFLFTVTGAALGYGLAAARENERLLDSLRGITQALLRAILPLAALVTIGFLTTLCFTGLDLLFATQRTATLLQAWIAVYILLLNGVYLDGSQQPPYSAPLRVLVETATLLLTVLAAIAGHALWLRIDEYGLTPDRVFAAALLFVLSMYSISYAAAVIARGQPWLPRLRGANVGMSAVVIVVGLALHTPLLDPLALSLGNQLARLSGGRVTEDRFDYAALRFSLGQRGNAALQDLAEAAATDTGRARVAQALQVSSYWEWQRVEGAVGEARVFWRVPPESPWPDGLEPVLQREYVADERIRCTDDQPCYVIDGDVDLDGKLEALVVSSTAMHSMQVFRKDGGEAWKRLGTFGLRHSRSDMPLDLEGWARSVREGKLRVVEPLFGDLMVGERRYLLHPE
ncbi:MAG TPA: DUF4153 domain-containing protein [Candidatus Limnocylindrales bacterium]|nr:DUF4153 domain-containing protein [Candidatus Limnocylindrales bacterium]